MDKFDKVLEKIIYTLSGLAIINLVAIIIVQIVKYF